MSVIVGVDEAGRGPLAGPVVAAAVILPNDFAVPLKDSKQLSHKQRSSLFEQITTYSIAYSIALASAKEIDKINILQASLLAMKRAILGLSTDFNIQECSAFPVGLSLQKQTTLIVEQVLVDGIYVPQVPYPCLAIIKGDTKIPVISAASILAKVMRDRLMDELAAKYPEYQWEQNKAYPTAKHLAALHQHGPCAEHRMSFAPVKNLLCSS